MATLRFRLLTLVCTVFLFVAPTVQQQCYYPNGQVVKNGSLGPAVPCPGVDSCCLRGDVCFTGGMCFSSQNGAAYRGFCTDSSWSSSSSCPSQCASGVGAEFMWVNSCGGTQSCCAGQDSTTDCCNSDKEFFWNFTPLNFIGSASATPKATSPVSQTTTVVATVTSTDTLVAYATGGSAKGAVESVSTTTVTAHGGANGRCEGFCGLIRNLGTLTLLWL